MGNWSSETDMANMVREWMQVQGWDVYPEVQLCPGGGRADLVGVRDDFVWVVECKLVFGLGVIAQAEQWLLYAHYVSVATPLNRDKHGRKRPASPAAYFGRKICDERGIGRIRVDQELPTESWNTWGYHPARLNRTAYRRAKDLRAKLCKEHKDFAPGNASAAYWTPFRGTCKAVLDFVKDNPGSTMRQVIDGIEHHYQSDTSARSTLVRWIGEGIVPGVTLDKTERVYRVVLADPTRNIPKS